MAFAALGDGNRAMELFSLLNPINHASTTAGVHRYKVEPYVMAADVYAEPPHTGRGGWTWYTGAAGWMYQAGVECDPRIPSARRRAEDSNPASPRHGLATRSTFATAPRRTRSWSRTPTASAAGSPPPSSTGSRLATDASVALRDDGTTHRLRVVLGAADRV